MSFLIGTNTINKTQAEDSFWYYNEIPCIDMQK